MFVRVSIGSGYEGEAIAMVDDPRIESGVERLVSEQVRSNISDARAFINRRRVLARANELFIAAVQLELLAQSWMRASQENFELGQRLNIGDPDERQDLDLLMGQADEYLSEARRLRAKATELGSEARYLRSYYGGKTRHQPITGGYRSR